MTPVAASDVGRLARWPRAVDSFFFFFSLVRGGDDAADGPGRWRVAADLWPPVLPFPLRSKSLICLAKPDGSLDSALAAARAMMAANDVGGPMGYWETVQLPVSASVWVPHWSFTPLSLVRVGSHRMWLFLCFLGFFMCCVGCCINAGAWFFFLWCYIGKQISSDVEFLSLLIIVVVVCCLCFPRVSGNQLSCAP